MTPRRFAALLAAALAVIAFAFWLSTQRYLPRDEAWGVRVFPGLEARLDAVDAVRVVGAGGKTLVTLRRDGGAWQVAERGYPADAGRVGRLLIAIAGLTVVEPKTASPAHYAQLGVEDVADPAATGVEIDLGGPGAPTRLIVGKPSAGAGGFVRVAGQPRALEATPALEVERDPLAWLDRVLVDVAPERVRLAAIDRADEPPWQVERAAPGAAFVVTGLPTGRAPASPTVVGAQANAVGRVEFEDVARGAELATGDGPADRATYRTFDGLVLEFEGRRVGAERWLAVAARQEEAADAAAAGDATRLAARAGWWHRVPAFRYEAIFRPREEVAAPR